LSRCAELRGTAWLTILRLIGVAVSLLSRCSVRLLRAWLLLAGVPLLGLAPLRGAAPTRLLFSAGLLTVAALVGLLPGITLPLRVIRAVRTAHGSPPR